MTDVTLRRFKILLAIEAARTYPPTVRDIGRAAGLRSSSSVYAQLKTLESMGFVEWDRRRARTLHLSNRGAAWLSMVREEMAPRA